MRNSCCSLPSGLVLQVLQQCCASLRCYNRVSGLLLLLGLRVGMAILRGILRAHLSGVPLPHLGTFGVPWQSMDYTKPCTMCSFRTSSPSPGSSLFCSWEPHGDTISRGTWSQSLIYLGYSLQSFQLKEQG